MASDPPPSPEPRPPGSPLRPVLTAGLGALLALGLAYAAGFRRYDAAPATLEVETTRPALTAITDLARLETVRFHLERVVDVRERQSALFGLVDAEDALLLVAAADVSAGVDLRELPPSAIAIDPTRGRAVLTLPAPEVFESRLDNERTYVHTRSTDSLARRNERLETTARRRAEDQLEQAARESGILERARENAERTLRALVESLGYDEVVIRWDERATLDGIAR